MWLKIRSADKNVILYVPLDKAESIALVLDMETKEPKRLDIKFPHRSSPVSLPIPDEWRSHIEEWLNLAFWNMVDLTRSPQEQSFHSFGKVPDFSWDTSEPSSFQVDQIQSWLEEFEKSLAASPISLETSETEIPEMSEEPTTQKPSEAVSELEPELKSEEETA